MLRGVFTALATALVLIATSKVALAQNVPAEADMSSAQYKNFISAQDGRTTFLKVTNTANGLKTEVLETSEVITSGAQASDLVVKLDKNFKAINTAVTAAKEKESDKERGTGLSYFAVAPGWGRVPGFGWSGYRGGWGSPYYYSYVNPYFGWSSASWNYAYFGYSWAPYFSNYVVGPCNSWAGNWWGGTYLYGSLFKFGVSPFGG